MSAGHLSVHKGLVVLQQLFPTRVIRWLMLLMLTIFLIGFALTELFALDLIGVVAGALAMPLVLIGMIILPTQMVALATHRAASFFPGLRGILLATYWWICLVLSLTICWIWNLSQLNPFSLSMFVVVWLITSLIFQASVWLCTFSQTGHFLLYAVYIMLGDIFGWFAAVNPLYILCFILLSWAIFAKLWLGWKPAHYKANPFFVGLQVREQMLWGKAFKSWFNVAQARTWLGSRLTGIPDGRVARIQRMLPALGSATVGFLPGYLLMGSDWLLGLGYMFLMAGGGFFAMLMLMGNGMNVHRIWLYSPGNRRALFTYLHGRFWSSVLPVTLVLVLVGTLVNLFWKNWHSPSDWLMFMVSLLLLQSLCFHLYWWLYQRLGANHVLLSFACGALVLCWFLMSIVSGFLMNGPASWPAISPLWILISEVLGLALLYRPVRFGFSKIEFVGAGQ